MGIMIEHTAAVEAELAKVYGEHLQGIREDAGVSQEEFARVLGLSPEDLALIENGTYAGSLDLCEAVNKAIGIYNLNE
jgi:DNA-binding XRE family transcriptional regulator